MKEQLKSGIMATVMLLTMGTSYSQPVPDQWTRTLELEGHWSGAATLVVGNDAFPVNYHTDFHAAVDGQALTMDEWFSDATLGDFKGTNLIGYSPYDDQIHWFSVDNFGTAHEHTGSWSNARHFHMEHQSIQGGQPFVEIIDLRLSAMNTRVKLKLVATLGGDTVQVIKGTLFKHNLKPDGNLTQESVQEDQLTIFPNPTDGQVIVESPDLIEEINITTESGQQVYRARPNDYEFSMQLEDTGIYFIRVIAGKETVTKKIILSK